MTIVLDLSNIEAAIDQLLALRQEGTPVEEVKLTLPSEEGVTEDDTTNEFFELLGSFPLVDLNIDFGSGGQVEVSYEWLATTIQATRPTLSFFTLYNLELTGDGEGLIRALRDHPCLTQMAVLVVHTGGNMTHESLISSLLTCQRLQEVTYLVYETQEGLGPALSSLCMLPSVKKLFLGGSKLKDYMPSLCQTLSTNMTLQHLVLRNFNGELESTFDSIGKMVEKNKALESLTLGVDPSALSIPIITALSSHNQSILSLRLVAYRSPGSDPFIVWPSSTLKALKDMVKENTTLLHLNLYVLNDRKDVWLSVSPPEYKEEIAFYLKLNQVGRQRLLLEENPTKELADAILSNHDDASVVFYLLSLNPSLLQVQSLAEVSPRPEAESLQQQVE